MIKMQQTYFKIINFIYENWKCKYHEYLNLYISEKLKKSRRVDIILLNDLIIVKFQTFLL